MAGGRRLLVGAAGGFDWDAGQRGGPAEQVGAVWSLLDELGRPLQWTGACRRQVEYVNVGQLVSYLSRVCVRLTGCRSGWQVK